jgi:hypothetical protein
LEELISTLDIVSLVASIASLILAVVAMFLAFHQKSEADKVNQNTLNLLIDIRSDAKLISQIALPELKENSEFMRNFALRNIERLHTVTPSVSHDDTTEGSGASKQELLIDLTDIGEKISSMPFNDKYKFVELIHMIYVSILSDTLPPETYGKKWTLTKSNTKEVLQLKGELDNRTLSEVGISPNEIYKLVLLT